VKIPVAMKIDKALEELNLERPVVKRDIVKAYHRMAKRFHPDKTTDPDEKSWASHKFLQIQQAYESLQGRSIDEINNGPGTRLLARQSAVSDRPNTEILFSGLAKWERHPLGHSLGQLQLDGSVLTFQPHPCSILDKGFSIRVDDILGMSRGDNLLWRGVVNIRLVQPLRLHFNFRIDSQERCVWLVAERTEFCSDRIRLFLGFGRDEFLHACSHVGIPLD